MDEYQIEQLQNELAQLEAEISEAEQIVDRRNKAIKLHSNPEFKELFSEQYFVNEAARLVHLSSDPALTSEQRADALSMAQASGHTRRYLSQLVQMGAHYERVLPEMKKQLAEGKGLLAAEGI